MTNNQLIVEKRETGKTTYLFNEIDRLSKKGLNIIVLDSATEHMDKSLLRKVDKTYENSITINEVDENKIVLGKISIEEFTMNFTKYFPFSEVKSNKGKIICFDLSYFLERGHEIFDETKDVEKYRYCRNLYNLVAQQIVLSLILMERYAIIDNSIVVMDEIELPLTDYDISVFQKGIKFISAVHPENAFGSFYQNFEKLNFKGYQKRKE